MLEVEISIKSENDNVCFMWLCHSFKFIASFWIMVFIMCHNNGGKKTKNYKFCLFIDASRYLEVCVCVYVAHSEFYNIIEFLFFGVYQQK